MSLFDEKFIEDLGDDPMISLFNILERYVQTYEDLNFEDHLETYALVETIILSNGMIFSIPKMPDQRSDRMNVIRNFLYGLHDKVFEYVQQNEDGRILDKFRKEFSVKVAKGFAYEFSQGDLDRIQVLLNEMRELVVKSSKFEENHKRRLLKRIERLQSELHKKQSDLDHLWGLIGDAGVVLGKFGKDAKPFADRIREIINIVWGTQSRAEELPSGTKPPLLSGEDKDEENDS